MRGERRRSSLTVREREVLDLVRVGLTNEEIAEGLGISPDTAKYHVSQILAKLGVASREEAAAWQPSEPRVSWWRLGAWGLAAKVVLVAAAGTAVIGVAALGWAVVQGRTGDSSEQVASQSAQPGATSQPASVQTQIGNLLFTVNGVSPYSDPRIPAEAGTHYVAVDLGIKNAGDQTGLNSSDFTVKDSAGYIDLSATTFVPEPLLGLVSIGAGEEVRGFIIFKIADGRDPVELRYRLDLFQNGGVIPLPTPIP